MNWNARWRWHTYHLRKWWCTRVLKKPWRPPETRGVVKRIAKSIMRAGRIQKLSDEQLIYLVIRHICGDLKILSLESDLMDELLDRFDHMLSTIEEG